MFQKGSSPPISLRWSQVADFDDFAAGRVALRLHGQAQPHGLLTIPTPDEGARTAALQHLDRCGIPRRA